MAKRRGRDFICVVREKGPQCGYVGYVEFDEAFENGGEIHWHPGKDGVSQEPKWGPESQCVLAQPQPEEATNE